MIAGETLVAQQVSCSSFRDPDGAVFFRDGKCYRRINKSYEVHYQHLMLSGLYQRLVDGGLLVSHSEVVPDGSTEGDFYKIILPEQVPFISYPYEWSFSQVKAAALATTTIQKTALAYGMSLKDSSAYNIQFVRGKPRFIDTLSFELYEEGAPWVAYKQFCEHFLAPLALMSYTDIRLNQLMRIHIDGIPLDLASRLLPWKSRLRLALLIHIHLHARSQIYFADRPAAGDTKSGRMSKKSLMGLVENLESCVRKLRWRPRGRPWSNYSHDNTYDQASLEQKKRVVESFLDEVDCRTIWDLGANVGVFSRIAGTRGLQTIAWDADPECVDLAYRQVVAENEANIRPLMVDLTNPSPAIGWANIERLSFFQRGPADLLLVLALVHHLALGNNVPLARIAESFASLCKWLVIEFVPKTDQAARTLLRVRKDIFEDYTKEGFERAFDQFFTVIRAHEVGSSQRTLYLMLCKQTGKTA